MKSSTCWMISGGSSQTLGNAEPIGGEGDAELLTGGAALLPSNCLK